MPGRHVAFSPRAAEEDVEVEGLFEAFAKDGSVIASVLSHAAESCSPFHTALIEESEESCDGSEPLQTPHSARSVPETRQPLDRVLSKADLRQILLAESEERRLSNAKWLSQQKILGMPTRDPEITFPGANEEERRDKYGPKVPKHLRIDELNLGELDDDAEFERIKRQLKGEDETSPLSRSGVRPHSPHDSVDPHDTSEANRERMHSVRNLSLAPITLTGSEQHLHRLQTQLHNIKALSSSITDTLDGDPEREGKRKPPKPVNAAILSELFSKHQPKKHTVDDVLQAIKREEDYTHGWEDQRRKPNTTVLFVGPNGLARRAQHGFVLPDVEQPMRSPSKGNTQTTSKSKSPSRRNDTEPINRTLPEWKQAWRMLSQRSPQQTIANTKYRHIAGTGLPALAQERPYHLSPLQRSECMERAASSMEHTSTANRHLVTVASQALFALNTWKDTQQSVARQPRSVSVPPELDSTAYARIHYASHFAKDPAM